MPLKDKVRPSGFLARWRNGASDFRKIFLNPKYYPAIGRVMSKALAGQGIDVSLSENDHSRLPTRLTILDR